DALVSVAAALSLDELRDIESAVLGKTGPFALAKKTLGSLPPEDRASAGARINEARAGVEAAISERRATLSTGERAKLLESERIDLTERRRPVERGHLHLVTQTQQQLEDVFVAMGYTVEEGPLVETDWHNFQARNIPPAHP